MTIDQASAFLAGSILIGLGCIVLVGAITVINNILARYWRPVNLVSVLPKILTEPTGRFATEEELARIAPQFENTPENKVKTK